jgi:hypothetical protein
MSRTRFAAVAALVCWLPLLGGGCARYEFDLVEPAELARHVGGKGEEVVPIDPLEYRLRAVEGRLVMNVINPTGDPVTLLGAQSYVVAPGGQSHPLRWQTIAPHTFVRLILPPMRPYYRAGPTFGIGVGVGVSHHHHYGGGFYPYPWMYDPFFDEPRYYTYYDESDVTYWEWKGESDVRIHLVYQRAGNAGTFSDDFTFHRKKM